MEVVQSRAILRLICRIGNDLRGTANGLYPEDPLKAAFVDSIIDQEGDAMMGMRVCKYKARFGFGFLGEEANASILSSTISTINSEVLPRHLASLANLLEKSGTGWLAGTASPQQRMFTGFRPSWG